MTAHSVADAKPYGMQSWSSIRWEQVEHNVRRLQARIVKALKRGEHKKVKTLQTLLRRSLSARLLAVKRVTTNRGSKTPGVDKIIWKTSAQKLQSVEKLKKTINPQPLRRIYIPKRKGKRPLGIPTMIDRAHQALHLQTLDPIAETTAGSHSYGFRINRGAADAIKYIFILLAKKNSAQWILEGDIRSCFDEISHKWIENHTAMDKKVLRKWLKAGFVENGRLYPTNRGTPQGGTASPALANITLNGLEMELQKTFGAPQTREARRNQIHICVYADDFIITGSSKELLEKRVKPVIQKFLEERGLTLSEEKTKVTHISEGFDFLGQNIRKYGKTLLIKPSKKSIQSVKEKLKETIRLHKGGANKMKMLRRINSILRGWCNYHRHVVSKRIFNMIDGYTFQLLWKWARHQHPKKNAKWVKNKYFYTINGRKWIFGIKTDKGEFETRYLATSTPIRRHVLIKSQANPYDPLWRPYFEKRKKANKTTKPLSKLQPRLLKPGLKERP